MTNSLPEQDEDDKIKSEVENTRRNRRKLDLIVKDEEFLIED